jgi:hypothetical protein
VFANVRPNVVIGPAHQRIELPYPAGAVPLHRLRPGSGRRLLTPDAGDPGVIAGQGLSQRLDLAVPAAAAGAPRSPVRRRGVHHLDGQPVPVFDVAPGGVRLGEQNAGVDGEHAGAGLDVHQQVDEHRLLLLEGAGHDEARMVALDRERDRLACV